MGAEPSTPAAVDAKGGATRRDGAAYRHRDRLLSIDAGRAGRPTGSVLAYEIEPALLAGEGQSAERANVALHGRLGTSGSCHRATRSQSMPATQPVDVLADALQAQRPAALPLTPDQGLGGLRPGEPRGRRVVAGPLLPRLLLSFQGCA